MWPHFHVKNINLFKDYNKGMKYLGDYFNQVERTDLLNY